MGLFSFELFRPFSYTPHSNVYFFLLFSFKNPRRIEHGFNFSF